METRRGAEESPRGLCEISSSIRPVNEPKQGEEDEEREQRERKNIRKEDIRIRHPSCHPLVSPDPSPSQRQSTTLAGGEKGGPGIISFLLPIHI